MQNFRKLVVWQRSLDFAKSVYSLGTNMPNAERYGITQQITRAAVSIPSNIAEGSGRESKKKFRRFLEISLGSAFELETQLLIVQSMKVIDDQILQTHLAELDEIQKMLHSLITRLKTKH